MLIVLHNRGPTFHPISYKYHAYTFLFIFTFLVKLNLFIYFSNQSQIQRHLNKDSVREIVNDIFMRDSGTRILKCLHAA